MDQPPVDRPWSRVPPSVGDMVRDELAGAVDEIVSEVRAQVPEYARPLEGRFGRRITEGVSVALAQFADLLGHDEDLADTRIYRALGQLEHREGRTLAALQSAYQVGTRTAWRRLAGSDGARLLPPASIFSLAEALFTYIEQLSAASVAGWAREEADRAGSRQTRRHALVELLARHPPAVAAEVERLAVAAGWRLPGRLAAVAAEDAVAVASRIPGALGADLDPVGVALVPVPERGPWPDPVRAALRGRPAALGPVVRWSRTHRSVARAQAVWSLLEGGRVGRAGEDRLVHADDHLLELLLAAESDLTEDLAARALAPLGSLPDGAAQRARQTLRAWLDAHGDVTATAATLHVHPQTVRYRLSGLREIFGSALDQPDARLRIALALRATPPAD